MALAKYDLSALIPDTSKSQLGVWTELAVPIGDTGEVLHHQFKIRPASDHGWKRAGFATMTTNRKKKAGNSDLGFDDINQMSLEGLVDFGVVGWATLIDKAELQELGANVAYTDRSLVDNSPLPEGKVLVELIYVPGRGMLPWNKANAEDLFKSVEIIKDAVYGLCNDSSFFLRDDVGQEVGKM